MSSEFEKTRRLARGQMAFLNAVLEGLATGAMEPDLGAALPVPLADLLATLAADKAAAEADLANQKIAAEADLASQKAVAEKELAAKEAEFQGRVQAFETQQKLLQQLLASMSALHDKVDQGNASYRRAAALLEEDGIVGRAVAAAAEKSTDAAADIAKSQADAVHQRIDDAASTLNVLLDDIDNDHRVVTHKLFEHRSAVIRSAVDTQNALVGKFGEVVDSLAEELATVLSASVSEPFGASIDELKVITGDLAREVQRIRTTVGTVHAIGVSVTDGFANMPTALNSGIEAAETDVANSISEFKMLVLNRLDQSRDAIVDHATCSAIEASTAVTQQLGSCKDAILHEVTSAAAAVDQALAELKTRHGTMLDSVAEACDSVTNELTRKMAAVHKAASIRSGHVASMVANIESKSGSGTAAPPPPVTATVRKRLRLSQDDSSLEDTRFTRAWDHLASGLRRLTVQDGTVSSSTILHYLTDALLDDEYSERFWEFLEDASKNSWYCAVGVLEYGFCEQEVQDGCCFCQEAAKYCLQIGKVGERRIQFDKGAK